MSVVINDGFKRRYVFPMSNATNGGEANTEYNVRSALSNILSYSGAFSNSDFIVSKCVYNGAYSGSEVDTNKVLELVIGPGRGNCNAYFVNCSALGSDDFPKIVPFNPEEVEITNNTSTANTTIHNVSDINVNFGLYVSVIYNQNIVDGVVYRFISNDIDCPDTSIDTVTEYSKIYENVYKPQGFNDIGILLGTMLYEKVDGVGEFGPFIPNPDITKCIDIYRLGSEDGIVDTLGRLITRLRVLNIFGGNFYVSDTLDDTGKDIKSGGVIDEYGGDYRLRIHEDIQTGDNQNERRITGGMDLVNVNLGGFVQVLQDLFSFKTNSFEIRVDTFEPGHENDIYIEEIKFNPDVVIQNDLTILGNLSGTTGEFSDSLTAKELIVSNGSGYCKIIVDDNSSSNVRLLDSNGNDTVSLYANKVYGAVWM